MGKANRLEKALACLPSALAGQFSAMHRNAAALEANTRGKACIGALCLLMAAVGTSAAQDASNATSKIKRRGGETVAGAVLGHVIQVGDVKQTTEGQKSKYSVTYWVTRGKEVEALDEQGLQMRKGALVCSLIASAEGSEPDALEIVKKGLQALDFQLEMQSRLPARRSTGVPDIVHASLSAGGSIIVMWGNVKAPKNRSERLLGTYLSQNGQAQLAASIQLRTDHGVLVLPVNEIVEFIKTDLTPK